MKIIQKGGLFIHRGWRRDNPDQSPYHYFLENCTIQILTDTSISCVTLRCRLDDGIQTPLMDMESSVGAREIREILIKVVLIRGINTPEWAQEQLVTGNLQHPLRASQDSQGRVAHAQLNLGGGGNQQLSRIYCTMAGELSLEIARQSWVYNHSYTLTLSEAEAICPCPLFYERSRIGALQQPLLQLLRQRINIPGVFVERTLGPGRRRSINGQPVTDISVVTNILTNHRVSLFAMELLTGYQTLADWISTQPPVERVRAVQTMCLYEYIRLGRCFGIQHDDTHYGNIMFNPTYPMFSDHGAYRGKVMIIDFGQLRVGPISRIVGGAGPEFVELCSRPLDDFFFLGGTRAEIAENLSHFWPRRRWDSTSRAATALAPHNPQRVIPGQPLLRIFERLVKLRKARGRMFHKAMSGAYSTRAYTVDGQFPIQNFNTLVRRITGADGVLDVAAFPWHGLTTAGTDITQQRWIGINSPTPPRLSLRDWETGDAAALPAEPRQRVNIREFVGNIGNSVRRVSIRILGALAAPFRFGCRQGDDCEEAQQELLANISGTPLATRVSNPAVAASAAAFHPPPPAGTSSSGRSSPPHGVMLGGSRRRRRRRTRRKNGDSVEKRQDIERSDEEGDDGNQGNGYQDV